MKRKRYKFSYGFFGYECSNFYKIVNPFLYKPALLVKQYIKDKVKKDIKFIVMDAPLWNRMVAYYKKRTIALTYGFYDINYNKIFINLPACGVKAYKDCTINPPTSSVLKKVSQIITHEFIHYQFQNNTNSVLSRTENILKTFYKVYWSDIVKEDIIKYVSRTNFLISVTTNKNITNPLLGNLTKNQIQRFISILRMLYETRHDLISNKKKMSATIDFLHSFVYEGSLNSSKEVEENIMKAYKAITNGFPKDLTVGQELMFASEILSVCANITTSKAEHIVKLVCGVK